MSDEPEPTNWHEPKTSKEVVVYDGEWGFRLPPRHELRLTGDGRFVFLSTLDQGGTYYVHAFAQTEDELRILVGKQLIGGHALGDPDTGYPFPTLEQEVSRLGAALVAAGEDPEDTKRTEGETHDSYTARLRAQLRARMPGRQGLV